MLSTVLVVLPVFALVFAGWFVRRVGVMGPHATRELNRFVVYLALPALLFDIVAHARWAEVWRPGFVAAFGLGAALVFALTVAVRGRRFPLSDAAVDGLNAAYGNTGYMGFPLALVALGPQALAPTLIATILTVCIMFAVAIVLIEVGLQAEKHPGRLALKVGRSLAANPLLVAPALASLLPVLHLAVPAPAETFLKLLGGAASPCALVALGLFLGEKREAAERTDVGAAGLLIGFKLLLLPLVVFGLATAFRLGPALTHAAVLLAALPTGTGPFMLAEFYRREAGLTSTVVLVSTVGSLLTISAYLAFVRS